MNPAKKEKIKKRAFELSILGAVLLWLLICVVEYFFFDYESNFVEILFFNAPLHIIVLRLVAILLIVIFGNIAYKSLREKDKLIQEMKDNKEKLTTILETAPIGMHIIDEKGKIIEWNKTLEDLTGIKKKDVLGKYNWDIQAKFIVDKNKREEILERIKKITLNALKTGDTSQINERKEFPVELPNGQIRWFIQKVTAIKREEGYWLVSQTQDITEIKEKEERLYQSEEKFHKIFSMNPIGIVIAKLSDGTIIDVNSTAEKLFGYPAEELIGNTTMGLNLWSVNNGKNSLMERIRVFGYIQDQDFDFIDKEGNDVFIKYSCFKSIVNDEECLIFFLQDVTKQRRAERELLEYQVNLEKIISERTLALEQANQELEQINQDLTREIRERMMAEYARQESEEKYRTMINQLPVGIYRTSVDGRVLEANLALANLFGFETIEEFKQVSVIEFFENPEDRANLIKDMKGAGDVVQYELKLKTIDGRSIWVRDTGKIIPDENGEPLFLDGIIEDITAWKLADMALKESEERYRLLFERLHDIYFRIDNYGRIDLVSPSVEQILEYTQEDVIGTYIQKYLRTKYALVKLLKKIRDYGSVNNYVLQILAKNGKYKYLSVDAHQYIDKNGVLIGFEGIARDITLDIRYQRYISTLFDIARAVNTTETLDELYVQIHKILKNVIECKNFFIAIYNKEKEEITFPYYADEFEQRMPDISINNKDYFSTHIIKTGKTIILTKEELKAQSEIYSSDDYKVPKIWIGIPLKLKDEVIGAIRVKSYEREDQYTEEDIELLESISDQIAIAIDRKRTELELNFQNNFLQTLIDTIPHPVYYKDAKKLQYIGCNQAFTEFVKKPKSEILGKTSSEIFGEERGAFYNKKDNEILSTGTVQVYEDTIEIEEGDVRNTIISRSCFRNPEGEIAGIVAIVMDITDIRRAEAEARQAKEYAEMIYNLVPNPIFTVDKDRRITSWNQRIAKLTGYSFDEIVGRYCDLCKYEADGKCMLFDDYIKKPIFSFETKLLTKYGEEKIISKNIDILRDENGEIIVGIESFEDITERKKLEEELSWQANINQALAEISKAVITTLSLNEMLYLLLQHALQLTQSTIGYIGYIDPKEKHLVVSCFSDNFRKYLPKNSDSFIVTEFEGIIGWSIKNKQSFFTNQAKLDYRYPGTPKWCVDAEKVISAPAMSGDIVVGQICLGNSLRDYNYKDIEILDGLASLLAVALQRRRYEEEIQNALNKEKELSELKSNFIAMVSHEYRTPLQAITMSADLLNEYSDKLTEQNRKKYFEIINKSVRSMEKLLEDIMSFNRMQTGKIEIHPELINVEQFILNFSYEMQYFAKGKAVIDVVIKGGDKNCYIDTKLVRQILFNIFSNSIKYSKEGSTIEFEVEAGMESIKFIIRDQGVGISEEDGNKIFEPFFRGKNVVNIPGSGLGLSIVRESVKALNGDIYFESVENQGTTFYVIIPYLEV